MNVADRRSTELDVEFQSDLELAKKQLEMYKQQNHLLREIEIILYEMKEIAEYAAEHELSAVETARLNDEILMKQQDILVLKDTLSIL